MSLISSISGLGSGYMNPQALRGADMFGPKGATGDVFPAKQIAAATQSGVDVGMQVGRTAEANLQAMNVRGIGAPAEYTPLNAPIQGTQTAPTFDNLLGNFVREVDTKQKVSNDEVNNLLTGKSDNLHQAVIAMQEAGVAFNLMVEVRNKLVESYQEIMRMQV